MGLSYSTDKTDETGKELLTYGTPDFPIAFFDDDLTMVKVPWHCIADTFTQKPAVYQTDTGYPLAKGYPFLI